ncbi:hypothetical protein NDU88_006319 [Pleurodeles waltl]|uniref:Uncharacterized protein n=1 Tax=Pleurodeles waltl TaxID=8319 RepID=A0AAV7MCI7_PLEWA|nr:hypothetical protein NDU88_006319 [Pleurodeles waltl]
MQCTRSLQQLQCISFYEDSPILSWEITLMRGFFLEQHFIPNSKAQDWIGTTRQGKTHRWQSPGAVAETKSANRVIWLHLDRGKVKLSGRPRWSPARLQVAGGLG